MAGTTVLKTKLVIIALSAIYLGLYSLRFAAEVDGSTWQRVLAGILGIPCVLMGTLTGWMASLRISYGHNLVSAYTHIIIMSLMVITRHGKVKRFIQSWKDPRKAQEVFLKAILKANGDTDYGREFGLSSVTSLEDLRKKHPLTDFERYRPYVDRMAKGELGVLTGECVERFALTSGTTGKSKMLPYGKSFAKMFNEIVGLAVDIRKKEFGIGYLQREMTIYTAPKIRYTEAGIPMGPASLKNARNKYLLSFNSSPAESFKITDPQDSVYVHLLFGFRDRNLRIVVSNFASKLMSAMRMVEHRWHDIVRDIELGTVTTTNVPPEIHDFLIKEMGGGDPKRAAELKREFEKGFEGIMKRVWPYLRHVQAIDSSGIKDALLKSYVKGLPLFGFNFSATESVIGVTLWPRREGKDEYVLLPAQTIMEFIPEANICEDQPDTLLIDQLQVGGVYEVVVTQMFGIYRFRFGDVIRVRRYHFNTPVVEFMYRSGQILNVHNEKLDQETVHRAIGAAVGHWDNVTLRQFAVAESTLMQQRVDSEQGLRPYYIIFLELNPTPNEDSLADIPLNKVDEELCRHSFTYNSFREKGSIAPPLVHIVKPGTFDRLQDYIMENSTTSANQYKAPRKLRTAETLKLMLDNSLRSTISDQ